MAGILQYQSKHQPWCRIFHNPAMTTECWCESQIAVTAYKLGMAEGMAMRAMLTSRQDEQYDGDLVPVNALPEVSSQ